MRIRSIYGRLGKQKPPAPFEVEYKQPYLTHRRFVVSTAIHKFFGCVLILLTGFAYINRVDRWLCEDMLEEIYSKDAVDMLIKSSNCADNDVLKFYSQF